MSSVPSHTASAFAAARRNIPTQKTTIANESLNKGEGLHEAARKSGYGIWDLLTKDGIQLPKVAANIKKGSDTFRHQNP